MDDETLHETAPIGETEEPSVQQSESYGQTPHVMGHGVGNRSFSEGEVDLSALANELKGMSLKT